MPVFEIWENPIPGKRHTRFWRKQRNCALCKALRPKCATVPIMQGTGRRCLQGNPKNGIVAEAAILRPFKHALQRCCDSVMRDLGWDMIWHRTGVSCLDHLHHASILVREYMTMQDVCAGEVDEAA